MTFEEYQTSVRRTMERPTMLDRAIILATAWMAGWQSDILTDLKAARAVMKLTTHGLGIAGEAGEVADLLKKEYGHMVPTDRQKYLKELGDVLWYVTAIAEAKGFTLEEVAAANKAKLEIRYPDGFTVEDSITRKDLSPDEVTEYGR